MNPITSDKSSLKKLGSAPRELRHFLCNLRDLRSDKKTTMTPITPITAKVVNAMSMFDIVIYLPSVNIKSHDKKCNHGY